jgi:NADPH:quinone reductase-like Zn-dependent oxidoreductase
MRGLELHSTIGADGTLRIALNPVEVGEPGPDELIVRVEAAPINPSDLGLLLGPADIGTMRTQDDALLFDIPPHRLRNVAARVGQPMPVGNEGAGTVIAAGRNVSDWIGRRVGMIGGGMFAQYRKLPSHACVPLPEGASFADGAAMFVNPLTALGFVETMKMEGHTALVHTAAASNLGVMLNRVCLADGIALVNIVRSEAQADSLRAIGARHVVDSSTDDFQTVLTDAIAETGATIGFDAIGGGKMASHILNAMEAAASRNATSYSVYGSGSTKQVYIYGSLDTAPTILDRSFGFAWRLGGWLISPFLQKAGPEVGARLRKRVADELTTTFASRYTAVIGLAEALSPDVLGAYHRKATGEKYLIDPTR